MVAVKSFKMGNLGMSAGSSDSSISVGLLALAAASFLALVPVQASAQEQENNSAVQCMSKTLSNGTTFDILVPANNTAAMRATDFQPVPCNRSFSTAQAQTDYRNRVCYFAATWSLPVQRRFARSNGVSPAALCGMAEQVVGPWMREGVN